MIPPTATHALQPGIETDARAEFDAVLHRCLSTQIGHLLSTKAHPADAPMRRYALVSAGQCEQGAVAAMADIHGLACERLFMQTPEADMADLGPWLIALPSDAGLPLREALAQQAAAQALALLSSPVRLPKLGEHLRSFMSGVLPDGSPALLRYFDPRVGFDMFTHWPDAVRQRFVQPLAWWSGWDVRFQVLRLEGPARDEIAPWNGALQLDAEWCKAMDDAGQAQLVVALLAEELEEIDPPAASLLARMHPSLRTQIARGALSFADGAGLTGWDNRALACRQALLVHARFHTHPVFEAALSGTGSPRLAHVFAHVPAQLRNDWAQDREPMLARLYDAQARVLLSSRSLAAPSAHDPGTR